jgi:hypothetical protein
MRSPTRNRDSKHRAKSWYCYSETKAYLLTEAIQIYLGLNLGLRKVGENAQVLWNDGGQGRSLTAAPAFSEWR